MLSDPALLTNNCTLVANVEEEAGAEDGTKLTKKLPFSREIVKDIKWYFWFLFSQFCLMMPH